MKILNFNMLFYVFRRDPPPFSGGHDLTNPDRGFWHFGGGPWLAELPSDGEMTMVRLHQNWYKLEIYLCYRTGRVTPKVRGTKYFTLKVHKKVHHTTSPHCLRVNVNNLVRLYFNKYIHIYFNTVICKSKIFANDNSIRVLKKR